MDLHLYNKSGGNPKFAIKAIDSGVGGSAEATIVAAVADKKIVPMWISVTSDAMGVANLLFDLKSGSTLLLEQVEQTNAAWPIFLKFIGDFWGKVGVNEAIKAKVWGSSINYEISMGYYLI